LSIENNTLISKDKLKMRLETRLIVLNKERVCFGSNLNVALCKLLKGKRKKERKSNDYENSFEPLLDLESR